MREIKNIGTAEPQRSADLCKGRRFQSGQKMRKLMKTDSERRFDDFSVRQAFYKSIPVLAGYVVIGIGFGPMRRRKLPHFIKFKGDQAK